MYFYGHPQNRFWKITAAIFGEDVPETVDERKAFLLRSHIAVWDSIRQCTITGSSDASIRDVIPNDMSPILEAADIQQIYCNGKKSWEMYHRYIEPATGRPAVCLPSSSPANAAWTLDRLIEAWSVIRA